MIINPNNSAEGIPPGLIAMWSGKADAIPLGWALCNGSNGTPNLQDRFIVGAGSAYSPGDTGGYDTVKLTKEQIPAHNHEYNRHNQSRGVASGTQVTVPVFDSPVFYTSSVGGSKEHENRPPYYALCFIMKQ